jgi:hypothetical protein
MLWQVDIVRAKHLPIIHLRDDVHLVDASPLRSSDVNVGRPAESPLRLGTLDLEGIEVSGDRDVGEDCSRFFQDFPLAIAT